MSQAVDAEHRITILRVAVRAFARTSRLSFDDAWKAIESTPESGLAGLDESEVAKIRAEVMKDLTPVMSRERVTELLSKSSIAPDEARAAIEFVQRAADNDEMDPRIASCTCDKLRNLGGLPE